MKRLLQLGFILGLAGTLAAAYFVPWFEFPRYRSAASVVANGGRLEQFMSHLPADRIGSTIDQGTALTGLGQGTRVGHFKLRDAEGNVIGLVARHELTIGDVMETSWLVTIPSRGTIALAATSPIAGSVDAVVAARGLEPGDSLDPSLSVDYLAPAKSVAATGEFEGIEFELVETWVVTGIDESGQIRGTLSLNTIGKRPS